MRTFWSTTNKPFFGGPDDIGISHEVYHDGEIYLVFMNGKVCKTGGFNIFDIEDAVKKGWWVEKDLPESIAFKPRNDWSAR